MTIEKWRLALVIWICCSIGFSIGFVFAVNVCISSYQMDVPQKNGQLSAYDRGRLVEIQRCEERIKEMRNAGD